MKIHLNSFLFAAIFACSSIALANSGAGQASMPVDCGEVVTTHFSGDNGFNQPDPTGAVVTLVDTRMPPVLPSYWPTGGTLWNPPLFSNFGAGIDEWTAGNLGTIFGLALSTTGGDPDIYVAASPGVYGNFGLSTPGILGPAGEGGIYKIDATTAQISIFIPTGTSGPTEMPNRGPGLGNIHFEDGLIYATNLDDGRIYVIDSSGTIIQDYDPFAPNPPADGDFAPLGERPYAIAIDPSGTTLYFSIWLRDAGRQGTPWPASAGPSPTSPNNSIWSVNVDASGYLVGGPTLEILLPYLTNPGFSNPVTDISFSPAGTMMLAERTYGSDYGQIDSGHGARILEYEFSGTSWLPSARNWSLGMPIVTGIAPNAVGGVASDDDSHTWASCDQIYSGGKYGLTRLPFPGNTIPTRITSSIPIELSGVYKNAMGELDCRTCNLPEIVGACCTENASGDFLCVEVTQVECDSVYAGIYFGDGSSCTNITCDGTLPVGACCYEDPIGILCIDGTTQSYCELSLNGMWYIGQLCIDVVCSGSEPTGACCYITPNGPIW
ncbi:MAG: hypothetical protein ACI9ON_003705, partial [Limisphaerales bacterium]